MTEIRVRFSLHFDGFPTLEEVEAKLMEQALKLTGGRRHAACELVGLSYATMYRKLGAKHLRSTKSRASHQ